MSNADAEKRGYQRAMAEMEAMRAQHEQLRAALGMRGHDHIRLPLN